MQCSAFREAASARLDGEPLGMPAADLDRHLTGCPACAAWSAAAADLTRRARLAAAPVVRDLTVQVLASLPAVLPGARAAARARLADTSLRVLLGAVAVAQAGLAWPALTSGAAAMSAPVHIAHETGAWNAALAVAFAAVALVPRLAMGSLPFLAAFAALLSTTTVRDLAAGRVDVDRALVHLLLLAGVAVVAVVAWRQRPRTAPAERRAVVRREVAA
jgi:predicted anti-sigma-YlaC factor YlaD